MKSAIVLAWLSLTSAVASAASGQEFSFRMGELVELARSGQNESALAIGDELLEPNAFTRLRGKLAGKTGGWSEAAFDWLDAPLRWAGFETRTARDRAAVQLARGVLLDRLQRPEEAFEACREARLLAGPGGTRLDATYDLGCLALREGERWRAQIPELAGAGGAPPVPPAAAPGGPTGPGTAGAPGVPGAPGAEVDPLQAAREAYLRAREHFVERLRADWQDGDTRANAELTLRRLRELAELEQQRQEQEQEQEQEQDQQQDSQQEGDSEESQDSQSQDPESQDEQQSEQDPDESEPSEEQTDESQEDSQEEQGAEDPAESEQEQAEGEVSEQELTREEVQRLLQRLSEHEKEGEELRSRIRRLRRVPVERDW